MRNLTFAAVACMLLALASAAHADLVAYYDFEEGTGTTIADVSGSGHTGTYQNLGGNSWVAGRIGAWAIDLNGSNQEVSTLNTLASQLNMELNKPKTVTAWAYTRNSANRGIFDLGQDGSAGSHYNLRTRGNGNEWRAQFWGGAHDFDFNASTQDTWAHFALTFDGSTARAYVDGAEVGSRSFTLNINDGLPFRIGRYGGSGFFNGSIDDVAVFDQGLTAQEVQSLASEAVTPLTLFSAGRYVWNNTDNNWGTANWTRPASPPPPLWPDITIEAEVNAGKVTVAADQAAYSIDLNGGEIEIAAGRTLTTDTSLNSAAGSLITLRDGATLSARGGSIASLQTAGSATIDVGGDLAVSGATFDGMHSAGPSIKTGPGTLSLDNSDGTGVINVENMTFDVQEGTLRGRGAQPLGGTGPTTNVPDGLVLSGGTFEAVGADVVLATDALRARRYNYGNASESDMNDIQSTLLVGNPAPAGDTLLTGQLKFDNDGQFNALIPGGNDQYTFLFTGKFKATAGTGSYNFSKENNDDRGVIYLDENQDGIFQTSERVGPAQWGPYDKSYDLIDGEEYGYAHAHLEWTGGSYTQGHYTPPAGTKTLIDPSTQPGVWSAVGYGAVDMSGTPITVTADSGLRAITESPAAFGDLTLLNDGVTLTTSGADMTFTDIRLAGATGTLAVENQVTMDSYSSAGPTTFIKSGAGTLVVDNSGSGIAAGATTFQVDQGILSASASNPLGGSTALELNGGTASFGGTANVSAINVLVTDHSTLDSQSGSPLAFPSVTLNNDRRLTTTGGDMSTSNLVLSGGTGILAPQNTLTVSAYNDTGSRIRMDGPGTLVIDNPGGGISAAGTTFEVSQGTLAASSSETFPHPLGDAQELHLSGGTAELRSGIYVPGMVIPAPLGHWTFDGDNANDSSGNDYHGTEAGPVAYSDDTPGGSGRSLDLTGGDARIDVDTGGTQDVFDGGDNMTISAWVHGAPASWDPFVCKNGEPDGWQMRRHGGNPTLDYTTRGVGANNGDFESAATNALDGNWHLVTMTFDGSTKAIYVDGVLNNTQAASGSIDPVDSLMVFGARDNGGFGNYFNGLLDDIYFFDQALSAADVASMYTGTHLGPLDMTSTNVRVTADSTLNAITGDTASFGDLSLENGTVTLTGARDGISFTGTNVPTGATAVGTNTVVNTTAGPFNAGGASATFTKTGAADLALGPGISGTANMSFDVQQGRLVAGSPMEVRNLNIAAGANMAGSDISVNDTAKFGGANLVATPGTVFAARDVGEASPAVVLKGGTTTLKGGAPAGVALWLDASDASTLTLNGSQVSQWSDKAGSGFVVSQGNAADQPDYEPSVSSINGQAALFFEGGSGGDVLTSPTGNSTGITGAHDLTAITVWTGAEGTGQNYQHLFHMGNTGTRQAYGPSASRGNNQGEVGNHYWGDGFNFTGTGVGLGAANIAVSTWDSATNTDSWWVNDLGVVTRTMSALNIATNQFQVGSRLTPITEGFRGYLAEVILFDRILDASEMNAVGGYLTDKYALTSNWSGGLESTVLPDLDVFVEDYSTLVAEATETLELGDLTVDLSVMDPSAPEALLTLETLADDIEFASINILDPEPRTRIPGQVYDLIALIDAQGSPRTGIFDAEMFDATLLNGQPLGMLDGEIIYGNDGSLVQFQAYIPEPGTMALLGLGLLGLARRRRRRKSR